MATNGKTMPTLARQIPNRQPTRVFNVKTNKKGLDIIRFPYYNTYSISNARFYGKLRKGGIN